MSSRFALIAALTACLIPGSLACSQSPDPDPLGGVRDRMAEASARARATDDFVERGGFLLLTGDHDEAAALVPGMLELCVTSRTYAARVLFAVHDYERLGPVIEDLWAAQPGDPDVRRLTYRWWVTVDDLARVDRELRERREAGELALVDRLMAAELALRLLDFETARTGYQDALDRADTDADRARVRRGLGRAVYEQRDFDGALDYLERALALSAPDPDLLMDYSRTLIRLGRTDEAIDAAELAVEIAPYHEQGNYYLGNGYARKNYTQLEEAYPEAFADGAGREAMAAADRLLAAGQPADARRAYEALRDANPGGADVLVRLGSLDFGERRYEAARDRFREALAVCPEYGRARNGMAKTVEGMRLAIEVHRPAYEERFAAAPLPDIPRLEEFVVNWDALSPRHRKQVAMAVAPWQRFLPVLIEGGSTYYIKPIYELLSETPGQEFLRDQRISYDSRLWDDVRGCGGYHTVTGIEDVERTVTNRYNTVLHELTHQVHSVLPAERKREIQELYRVTKERDETEGDAFLSRYAGGSVWEYFAEGANSLESPRRDEFDTRDIVRERLEERDPRLRALVLELMNAADVDSCYPVAYANLGDDRLERGRPAEAIAAYRKALARAPGEETATASLVFALQVADELDEAVRIADEAAASSPESAEIARRRAAAWWHAGRGLDAALAALEEARGTVREEERYRVDASLGRLRWTAGDAKGAREAYRAVLDYQADSPEGLWGMAAAHGLGRDWNEAWDRYEEAVRQRSGVVELRNDFAHDLLRAGEVARAREQVAAALLLDPEDPTTLALEAWVRLEEGQPEDALIGAERALEHGPWCDLALIIRARAERALGNTDSGTLRPLRGRIEAGAPPEYVYREKWGRYDEVHVLDARERELLETL